MKVLEYLACGVPVLASDIKAHRDIGQQLEGVFLYRDGPDLLKIIRNSNQRVYQDLESFSWSGIAKTYQEIYQSL